MPSSNGITPTKIKWPVPWALTLNTYRLQGKRWPPVKTTGCWPLHKREQVHASKEEPERKGDIGRGADQRTGKHLCWRKQTGGEYT
eukprot:1140836-Pelagomonas_calceolata.AAC.1